jgi:hypothetical protein
MPHINNHGPPLKLDKSNFTIWKTLMKSHICSASTQLWGIIKIGFYPRDPSNLTSRKRWKSNSTPPLQVPESYMAHIWSLAITKDAGDHVISLIIH